MNERKEMDRLFDRLFPLLRSITGEGLRETLAIRIFQREVQFYYF